MESEGGAVELVGDVVATVHILLDDSEAALLPEDAILCPAVGVLVVPPGQDTVVITTLFGVQGRGIAGLKGSADFLESVQVLAGVLVADNVVLPHGDAGLGNGQGVVSLSAIGALMAPVQQLDDGLGMLAVNADGIVSFFPATANLT